MPTALKQKKKTEAKESRSPKRAWLYAFLTAAGGAILGLSAPGLEQWYLAWFGLVPLILLVVSSPNVGQALMRGFTFGTAYNLVYLNWYWGLHPMMWLGFNRLESMLMAAGIWMALSIHQGLITAIFAGICRVIPLAGGFIPKAREGKWGLPALLFIPLLWVIMQNKVGNAHDLLGVPWSMIEYSQYRQIALIQVGSIIGGIGLGFLIVLANSVLASLIATFSKSLALKSIACESNGQAVRHVLSVALCLSLVYAWGLKQSQDYVAKPAVNLAILQGDVEIEKLKSSHPLRMANLLSMYQEMLGHCPQGLCIWAENAFPTYLKQESTVVSFLARLAVERQVSMIIGSLDRDQNGRPYSSAYCLTRAGNLLPDVYHKRYLVPFGEYMPQFVEYLPECLHRLTSTAAGKGLASGVSPVVWPLRSGNVAPLVCFEAISPEIVASSVRKGGALLVNISDLCWFHNAMIGQQMLAFSVMRAVESKRFYVFAANTGPSAIIDPTGRITSLVECGKQGVLLGKAAYSSEITPFTWWFR